MTQTIRTPHGRSSVWIEADYGQGRRGKARLVTWSRISLPEFLEPLDLQDLDADREDAVKRQLAIFKNGYAWQAVDGCESAIFCTEKEARSWAFKQSS